MKIASLVLIVAGACGLFDAKAPIPKAAPPAAPKKLTVDDVTGTWDYEWSDWRDGWITFDADGTFSSQFATADKCDRVYFGTWTCDGDTITIFEYVHTISTNQTTVNPSRYDFQFPKLGRKLVGKSNKCNPVTLSNRSRP